MEIILGILEQGLIYAIMALGVYITYKILDFPDLTVDSSFPLGAAVTATLILHGLNPYTALLFSFLAGAFAGAVTGFIHVKCQVRDLLSGIITMTAFYSINLHIAGKANLPIFSEQTIFTNFFLQNKLGNYCTLVVVFLIMILAKILLDLYLQTKSGYLLRAVGDNVTVVTSLAKESGKVKILGLVISNGLVALSGSVMCQQQRFFEISMGTGTIVIGLATVIIGINLFQRCTFIQTTTAVVLGSILYKTCVAVAISFGMEAMDMKLITAVLFLGILVVGRMRKGGRAHA